MLATLLAGVLASSRFDFYSEGPYDDRIPRPESILGYGPGDRHTTFRDQEQVIFKIAESSKDRVKVMDYGKSVEGRPLRIIAISSPANIKRLDQIKKEHQLIAEGKGDPDRTVPIVWINQCIHGSEAASFETAMWTLYNLAASRGDLAKTLEKAVVILNPVYNPDGHERYVVYYNSLSVGSADRGAFEKNEPGTIFGRTNHYRFDLNRDRISFSQVETRQEFDEMLSWGPQVYMDQHGEVGSYFFPPEPMSINPNVDRTRKIKWSTLFGKAKAKAFDANGLSYYVKSDFDMYFPGYLDSSTTLSGAIGMTHETDAGRNINSERGDGSILTLKQGVFKHMVSALAGLKASAENGQELMRDYAKFKEGCVTGRLAGSFRTVAMQADDERALVRVQQQLKFAGIESLLTRQDVKLSRAHDYWSDDLGEVKLTGSTLLVDMAQPQSMMAKALLEPRTEFEPEFIKQETEKRSKVPEGERFPGPEGSEFYDMTGWSLPYAHGLRAWHSAEKVSAAAAQPRINWVKPGTSSIGYALQPRDQDDLIAVHRILNAGVRGFVMAKPMNLAGIDYDRGTILFLAERNDDGYEQKIFAQAESAGSKVTALTSAYPHEGRESPGSESRISLRAPKIALVMGEDTDLADCGAMWWLLEREFKLPFTPIPSSALNGDLSRFTAVILPSGARASTSGRFREWVNAGGTAIALGSAEWALGDSGFVALSAASGVKNSHPGGLFRVEFDPRSLLSAAYPSPKAGKIPMAAPFGGRTYYQFRKEGGSVVAAPSGDKVKRLLSGWEWPDETEKVMDGAVFLQEQPIGRGRAVLFLQDPTERAMWPAWNRALLSALVFSPTR